MNVKVILRNKITLRKFVVFLMNRSGEFWVVALAIVAAISATAWSFHHGYIISYGDAESHLNIAKRVVHSLTPGFAQLGGIWLPLPHLLMVPLVYFDSLWRSGLAGSIVSGLAFVISCLYLYKLGLLVTGRKIAGVIAALIFMTNPNLLYLQSTPMTELPLIAFFMLSSYYFIRFLLDRTNFNNLLLAALFGFCASLTRYDGWFLVISEAAVLVLLYLPLKRFPKHWNDIKNLWRRESWGRMQGHMVLFSTLAFLGIVIWLAWDFLILGDPLYFTHSEFSAKSQQQSWLARGELPAYKNLGQSLLYYLATTISNSGAIAFGLAVIGLLVFVFAKKSPQRWLVILILLVPFIFNVVTLYLGQSVIFIPSLTPETFEWTLFNVRYGVMMVPLVSFIIGYMFYMAKPKMRTLIAGLLVLQIGAYAARYSTAISLQDGISGLSSQSAKTPDAQYWIAENYDNGLVLVDDFARTLSVIRTRIPMQEVIYVGNKPYWEESLEEPEKYARWIIMQKDDQVWKNILENPAVEGRLYTYFERVYTSPEILVFRRNNTISAN